MRLRIALLATTLAVTSFAARSAQALSFSVQATAQTLGYPGCFTDDSGWLPGNLSASAVSDPAGYTFPVEYKNARASIFHSERSCTS